jgi:hypothetical protein
MASVLALYFIEVRLSHLDRNIQNQALTWANHAEPVKLVRVNRPVNLRRDEMLKKRYGGLDSLDRVRERTVPRLYSMGWALSCVFYVDWNLMKVPGVIFTSSRFSRALAGTTHGRLLWTFHFSASASALPVSSLAFVAASALF